MFEQRRRSLDVELGDPDSKRGRRLLPAAAIVSAAARQARSISAASSGSGRRQRASASSLPAATSPAAHQRSGAATSTTSATSGHGALGSSGSDRRSRPATTGSATLHATSDPIEHDRHVTCRPPLVRIVEVGERLAPVDQLVDQPPDPSDRIAIGGELGPPRDAAQQWLGGRGNDRGGELGSGDGQAVASTATGGRQPSSRSKAANSGRVEHGGPRRSQLAAAHPQLRHDAAGPQHGPNRFVDAQNQRSDGDMPSADTGSSSNAAGDSRYPCTITGPSGVDSEQDEIPPDG